MSTKSGTGITLDNAQQFVTLEGRQLGVFAHRKGQRYQYRGTNGTLYGSGMTPAEFCKCFWMRDDFTDTSRGDGA